MDDHKKWFAMGAPYRNELKVRDALGERGIECFLPMVTRVVEVRGRKVRKTEPAVSNLLFVHTTEDRLKAVKPFIPRLQYKTIIKDGLTVKAVVPDADMQNFIRFIEGSDSKAARFVYPGELELKKGPRVRVVGGGLDGITGTLLKASNRKSNSLVVSLDGIISAQVDISLDLVEVIS